MRALLHKRLEINQTSITMSSAYDIKVATTYFLTQPDDICMNKVRTEPTRLRIIKFKNYLHQCSINITENGETLRLLVTVLAESD